MNVGVMGIMIIGVLMVAGLIGMVILVIKAFSNRNSNRNGSVVGYVILAFLGIPFAIGLLLPTLTHRRTVTVSNEQITPLSSPAPVPVGQNDQRFPIDRSSSETNAQPGIAETYVISTKENDVRGTLPNMILIGLSMIALLALARVAVDGRKDSGYGMPARLLAASSFMALCVLLWALSPMV